MMPQSRINELNIGELGIGSSSSDPQRQPYQDAPSHDANQKQPDRERLGPDKLAQDPGSSRETGELSQRVGKCRGCLSFNLNIVVRGSGELSRAKARPMPQTSRDRSQQVGR